MTPPKRLFCIVKGFVILSEAKDPVRFFAKLTGFFVASLLRMTKNVRHLNRVTTEAVGIRPCLEKLLDKRRGK